MGKTNRNMQFGPGSGRFRCSFGPFWTIKGSMPICTSEPCRFMANPIQYALNRPVQYAKSTSSTRFKELWYHALYQYHPITRSEHSVQGPVRHIKHQYASHSIYRYQTSMAPYAPNHLVWHSMLHAT